MLQLYNQIVFNDIEAVIRDEAKYKRKREFENFTL